MIEINGKQYQIGKLSVFDKLHVARKVAPLLAGLGQSFNIMQEQIEKLKEVITDEESSPEDFFNKVVWAGAGPIADALSNAPEQDIDYIVKKCLSVVTVLDKQTNRYMKILASNGQPMQDDIDLITIIRLVWEVIQDNLGNFFPSNPGQTTTGVE